MRCGMAIRTHPLITMPNAFEVRKAVFEAPMRTITCENLYSFSLKGLSPVRKNNHCPLACAFTLRLIHKTFK